MRNAIWILGFLIIILIIIVGAGIIIQLEDIQTTLRLIDAACPTIERN